MKDGAFRLEIGSNGCAGLPALFAAYTNAYLALTVGQEKLMPRVQFKAVPYAMQAQHAENAEQSRSATGQQEPYGVTLRVRIRGGLGRATARGYPTSSATLRCKGRPCSSFRPSCDQETPRRLIDVRNSTKIELLPRPFDGPISYAMPGDCEKALIAGCTGYIEKSIDPSNFAAQIETYLHAGRSEAGAP